MKQKRNQADGNGFALVAVLSMMVLLTVLAVGLLGLSAVTLRAGGATEHRAAARANARLALMLAIGEVQKTLGPDQGVSASATAVAADSPHPNLLGTWQSWRWEPGDGAPDYAEKEDRFRRWLVSAAEPATAAGISLAGAEFQDPVVLIDAATTGRPADPDGKEAGLSAGRVPLDSGGAFAWAVMDESQKAPVHLDESEPGSDGERLARRTAPSRARPELLVESLTPDRLGAAEKIVSLDTAAAALGKADGTPVAGHQADLTTHSLGLLTRGIDGGMKTDLTTLFESDSATAVQANGATTVYGTDASGAPRWDYLRSHYQLSRKVAGADAGTPVVRLGNNDLTPSLNGITVSPRSERLMPVILKLQIMFSLVSHHPHVTDRVNFYNRFGDPQGNENYACPHLAYDPVITLYNPYDVALDLAKLRIRIWDPPVVFGFKKNDDWLRPEFAGGEFHGLARFQIVNESDVNARRSFTLYLRDLRGAVPGGNIRLEPGEVKVFSPWVEPQWTWGLETAKSLDVRCFFDFSAGRDFGNRDGRTNNALGVETVPGWDPRAGLQADHLSYTSRPLATRYDFEQRAQAGYPSGMDGGWVAIKTTDSFTVQAKPGRTVAIDSQPDFVVDLLAGTFTDPARDFLRSYRFRCGDVAAEIGANPGNTTIERTFLAGDILQTPADRTAGGKSPFAIFSMAAKTTRGELDLAAPWLHNHPVVEGAEQTSTRVGNALDSYDLRFEEVADFNANPGGIELEPGTQRGYYGATSYSNGGASQVPMFRVPLVPAASLGDLIPANLVAGSHLPRVTHALGNSRAHPLIPAGAVRHRAEPDPNGQTTRNAYDMLDHSYLINDALWDDVFFSTVAGISGGSLLPATGRRSLLEEFLADGKTLLNPRFVPAPGVPASAAEELDALGDAELSRRMAGVMAVRGPFNVNSDSVAAWKALLASLRDGEIRGWNQAPLTAADKTGFPRAGLPLAGDADGGGATAVAIFGESRWAGFRALTDEQVARLARRIVEEIRKRGRADRAPALTVAEFVNRRPGAAGALHALAGLLQTAIDASGVNEPFHDRDSKDLAATPVTRPQALTGLANAAARQVRSAEGAPALLTQGDLLMALAPVVTVRGDTFRIRAYGESKGADDRIEARAWCEAVVQRIPAYLDPADEPQLATADLSREANRRFGRRLSVVSFRWLSPEEV